MSEKIEFTQEILNNAIKYLDFCNKCGNKSVNPKIKHFCKTYFDESYYKLSCPVCDCNELFNVVVRVFFLELGMNVDLRKKLCWGCLCVAKEEYFLDGIYRLMKGESIDEMML